MGNAQVIEELYGCFAKGDVPGVLAAFAEDIEWTEAEGFPYGGTYRGAGAVLENVFMKLGTEWTGFSAIPSEIHDAGETVIALGTYSGTYNATGKSFSAPYAHVWKLRDGKVYRFVQYTDTLLVSRALQS